jgi:hypothetical protein
MTGGAEAAASSLLSSLRTSFRARAAARLSSTLDRFADLAGTAPPAATAARAAFRFMAPLMPPSAAAGRRGAAADAAEPPPAAACSADPRTPAGLHISVMNHCCKRSTCRISSLSPVLNLIDCAGRDEEEAVRRVCAAAPHARKRTLSPVVTRTIRRPSRCRYLTAILACGRRRGRAVGQKKGRSLGRECEATATHVAA